MSSSLLATHFYIATLYTMSSSLLATHFYIKLSAIGHIPVYFSIISVHLWYTYVAHAHALTLEGSVYWDEYAETCSKISRAVGFRGAARF